MYYLDLLVNGLVFGCMYAMTAMGLTLVYGLLRILHVAHAAVFTLGAFTGVVVANATGSLLIAFPVAVGAAVLVGIIVYRVVYEPLLKHPPYVPLIASIGLLILLEDGFRIVFGEQGLTFRSNPYYLQSVDLFGINLNVVQIVLAATAIVSLGALAAFIGRSRAGVAWRATVSNPRIATSFGVDVVKVRYLNFAIGSALAAVAGLLVALLNNLVEPSFGSVVSYKALAIIVLGGLGSMRGAMLASLVLGVAESFGTVFVGDFLDRDAIAAVVLILVLMVRPQGFARTAAA